MKQKLNLKIIIEPKNFFQAIFFFRKANCSDIIETDVKWACFYKYTVKDKLVARKT